jgi:HEAT repeat protein
VRRLRWYQDAGVNATDRQVAAKVAALESPDPAARAAALRWLGTYAPTALTIAHASLFVDPVLAVRAAAAVALRGASDPALVQRARLALRELIRGDAAARHAGLRAAAALANPTLAPRLAPFLAHADPETRRLCVLALAAIPPGWLASRLLETWRAAALADPDPGVRAAALAWIIRADPR